ncbi:MAG TPA: carboxypeptidase-like regulatory domain-containing protein, partial [Turneriella sp.]|nr:carboxypeptidase-like regulatory domain-containing protein [Turneriella sp.]
MVFEKKFAAVIQQYCPRINSWAILALSLFTLNCFSSEKALPGVTGTGQISGKVVGPDGTGISGVTVTTAHNGEVLTATSTSSGLFSFTLKEVQRGTGFNLQFTKTNFENASQAAVISLPNLKVDMGNVVMYITGSSAELTVRKITGQVLDNFSYKPLAGANVTTTDSAGQVLVVTTDDNGRFTLGSSYFALASTFAVGVYKSNYITRTDLIAVITAEENTIRNNPIRLYQKFGSVYGYVTEDSLGTALNGVSVTLTNSNNQQITCYTGGNAGTYDSPEPLAPGLFCPDMDDDFGTTNFGANGGGFKIKDQFLLLAIDAQAQLVEMPRRPA